MISGIIPAPGSFLNWLPMTVQTDKKQKEYFRALPAQSEGEAEIEESAEYRLQLEEFDFLGLSAPRRRFESGFEDFNSLEV